MNVRELIEALSVLDQDLPVLIRERGWVPVELYPPFERRFSNEGRDPFLPRHKDHVLLEADRSEA